MNLVARLKRTDEPKFRVMPLVQDIIPEVETVMTAKLDMLIGNNLEIVDYQPGYILGEGEVFKIEDEDIAKQFQDLFHNTAGLDRLAGSECENPGVGGVFGQWEINNRATILGQSLTSAYALHRASGITLAWHDCNNYVRLTAQGITLKKATDLVVYENEIRFINYNIAARLVDLTSHFTEATDDIIRDFVALDIFSIEIGNQSDAFLQNADTWVRRKVALILKRGVLERTTVEQISRDAESKNIELDLTTQEGSVRIRIPTEKPKLKMLLKFLDEDFFDGSLSGDRFITNSKRNRS
jgi:hypothetical protein